jgi:Xaa-Pro aminopeptidase
MIDRRSALTGLALSGAVVAVSGTSEAAQSASRGSAQAGMEFPTPLIGPRMNMAQAHKIMDRLGLDALVVGQGVNLYHATGYWPITTRMGHAPNTFAIVTRNESQPLSVVLSSFTYYYQLADVHRSDDFAVYQYTAPASPSENGDEPDATPLRVFRDLKEVPMDSIETRRASLAHLAEQEVGAFAGAKYALAKAIKDLGLSKATVAVDHPSIAGLLEDVLGPTANIVDADEALRRIRPIKSDVEITLMRRAAKANTEAALAAVHTVRAGATYRELRATFFAEAAQRGNKGEFMVVDRVSADLFDAPFRDGQAFLIDAVSAGEGYHGDYGRTVFIGEPSRPMAQATKSIGAAWDVVRHALKPGMRFSEISALGQATLKKMGADYTVSFGPHSVGLYHTDHVGMAGAAAFREDHVLEKGMIISVDCPMLESGVGGSAHLEDLMLITEDGSEPIHDIGDQTIIV